MMLDLSFGSGNISQGSRIWSNGIFVSSNLIRNDLLHFSHQYMLTLDLDLPLDV